MKDAVRGILISPGYRGCEGKGGKKVEEIQNKNRDHTLPQESDIPVQVIQAFWEMGAKVRNLWDCLYSRGYRGECDSK